MSAEPKRDVIYKCKSRGCELTFTKKNIRRVHMNSAHEFCEKCDKYFYDWDDLVSHRMENPTGKHHACKFCGQDYNTPGGRDRHLQQSHPVDQDLACVGCGERFIRAAALIDHLEKGHCSRITAHQFLGHLQHKNVISKLLDQPELIASIKANDMTEAARDDDVGGGVTLGATLLDNQDEGDADGLGTTHPAMQPAESQSLHIGPKLEERWPALSIKRLSNGTPATGLADGFEKLKVSSPGASATEEEGRDKGKVPAWASGGTSSSLFSKAKPTPVTPDWEQKLKAADHAQRGANLFHIRFWDPTHPEYNPERFFNSVIERYICPFPSCQDGFQAPMDLAYHIQYSHRTVALRCPRCLKLFNSTTGLISHCEAINSRCGIAHTKKFGQAIDQFSGGFLRASEELRPDLGVEKWLANTEDAETEEPQGVHLDDSGGVSATEITELTKEKAPKVTYMKYDATLPVGWELREMETTDIGGGRI